GSLDPDAVARLQSGQGGAAPFVVVHLRDGGCACNRAADEHFLALQALYPAHDVVFAVSDAPGHAMSTALERLPSLTAAESERLWRNLPATPAVAVFDPAGRPVYLGPYADIARCSTARGGPVEAAVMNPLRQSPDAPSPIVAALGCFCSRGPRA
ncbi:MAG: hypothetical protein KIT73_07800, partial [Burkholderiales bacterium]|nr:hypothetical protein [Burkholderiales bacterium]